MGCYGEQFGAPEFEVELKEGKVVRVTVVRGAPCGASWEAAIRIIGLPAEEAVAATARSLDKIWAVAGL